MLLELAQELLDRAQFDRAEPIPVILSLSAWKDPKQPIFEWLLVELKAKYGLPLDLAKHWLEKHQLLPLLDGLDEVAPQHQKACALAINNWLTGGMTERPCGVLICCRREEFEQVVQEPLSLYGAIYVQALNSQQIEEYFVQFDLQDVWKTVHQDAALQELLTKPLFLSMFGLVATQGKFVAQDWSARSTSEEKVEYLLDTYWEATIERELILDPVQRKQGICSKTYGKKPLPTRQAVRRSLVFAAQMLNQDSSTELLIEKLQPNVLRNEQKKWVYRLIVGLISGLFIGLMLGVINDLIGNLNHELIGGLFYGLILGLYISLIGGLDIIRPVEIISMLITHETRQEVLWSIRNKMNPDLRLWLSSGLILGLIFVAIGLVDKLLVGSFNFLTYALILGLMSESIDQLIRETKIDVENWIRPNQGINNLFKKILVSGAICITIALLLQFVGQYFFSSITNSILSYLVLLLWLSFQAGGGQAWLQHIALRIVLAWNRYAPFRYDLLLDYCTERLLLQRIGGRYRFMHRLLQDHFAQMDL